jgi:hypothetical protein
MSKVTSSPLPPRFSQGKGSTPRNCNSKAFLDNYQEVDWGKQKPSKRKDSKR